MVKSTLGMAADAWAVTRSKNLPACACEASEGFGSVQLILTIIARR